MTDQELLQAIGQVVEDKMEPMRLSIRELRNSVQRLDSRMDRLEFNMDRLDSRLKQVESRMDKLEVKADKLEEQVQGIRIYMDTDQRRELNLLLEGQQALWDRFAPREELEPLKDRVEVLELTAKRHSQEIWELQPA